MTADDVKSIVYHVLRHRLILTYEAEAENMTTDQVIKEILNHVEVSVSLPPRARQKIKLLEITARKRREQRAARRVPLGVQGPGHDV